MAKLSDDQSGHTVTLVVEWRRPIPFSHRRKVQLVQLHPVYGVRGRVGAPEAHSVVDQVRQESGLGTDLAKKNNPLSVFPTLITEQAMMTIHTILWRAFSPSIK